MKRKKRPQQSKASNIIGIIASVIILLVAVFYLYVALRTKKVKQLENDYDRIEKPFIEANKLSELNNTLSKKIDVFNNCKSGRINWADKWLELAKITPENIYITNIEIQETDKKANNQKMIIKARAASLVDESAVLQFLDCIEKNAVFTNDFKEISLSAVYLDGDEKAFSIELLENKK
jgi:cell division protein FtsL